MRRFILFFFSCLYCITAVSENYQVSEITGEILFKRGNSWLRLEQLETISGKDSIAIKENAFIKITDLSTSRTYSYDKVDKLRVGDIILKDTRESLSWIERQFTTLFGNIYGPELYNLWPIGGIKKGQPDLERDLAMTLMASYNEQIPLQSDSLTITIIKDKESKCYFDISNNTSDTLYVNILVINKKLDSYSLLYKISNEDKWMLFPIAACSSFSFSSFLVSPSDNYSYIVFGSKTPYYAKALIDYLDDHRTIDNIDWSLINTILFVVGRSI